MIKRATVRRARMTGYQKRYRKVKGNIYVNKKWLGKRVIVLLYADYLEMGRQTRKLCLFKSTIKRLLE